MSPFYAADTFHSGLCRKELLTCKKQILHSEGLPYVFPAPDLLCHLLSLQGNVRLYVMCPKGLNMPFRECSKHLLTSFGWAAKHQTTSTSSGDHYQQLPLSAPAPATPNSCATHAKQYQKWGYLAREYWVTASLVLCGLADAQSSLRDAMTYRPKTLRNNLVDSFHALSYPFR